MLSVRLNDTVLPTILAAIEYTEKAKTCSTCIHFTNTDCSGSHNAKPAHCHRNAFWFPVSEYGCCLAHEQEQEQEQE